MAEPYTMFTSKVVPIDAENVDTDQIVPARYLKVTDKAGLAEALFRDWRFEEDGSLKDPPFILDQPEMAGRKVLLVGDNFGAGSSREHAPWALTAWGVRAILSTSYADIFQNNSLKNGLLPIVVSPDVHRRLLELDRARSRRPADDRPRRGGRPAPRRIDDRLHDRPVREADAPRRDRRARLPPVEGRRDRGLGGGPPAADRYARRSALTDPCRSRLACAATADGTHRRDPSSRGHADHPPLRRPPDPRRPRRRVLRGRGIGAAVGGPVDSTRTPRSRTPPAMAAAFPVTAAVSSYRSPASSTSIRSGWTSSRPRSTVGTSS